MDMASYETRIKQWTGIIQEANASGMTKSSWCKLSSIPLGQFYYWQKKVKNYTILQTLPPSVGNQHNSTLSLARNEKSLPAFCELQVPTGQKQLYPLNKQFSVNTAFIPEMVLQSDHFQLLIGNTVTEKTLSAVLSVLSHV